MRNFPFEHAPGATPLDPNETAGLIPRYISTQSELNLLEQENILRAQSWLQKRKSKKEVLTDDFVRKLHKQMFKDVWKWAGKYRASGKNIGIAWDKVPEEIRKLCEDTNYWIMEQTFPWNELGARFHHRLVFIHAFANGNGRHARMITDILLETHGQEAFTWGSKGSAQNLADPSVARKDYISALREADGQKFEDLIKFVKS